MQDEIDVVRNLEDAVARRDPGEGHEANHAGDGKRQPGDPEGSDRSNQSKGHRAHDDQRQHRGSVAAIKNGEDQCQR